MDEVRVLSGDDDELLAMADELMAIAERVLARPESEGRTIAKIWSAAGLPYLSATKAENVRTFNEAAELAEHYREENRALMRMLERAHRAYHELSLAAGQLVLSTSIRDWEQMRREPEWQRRGTTQVAIEPLSTLQELLVRPYVEYVAARDAHAQG